MMTYSEAGKGSAPRKARDDAAYASGWERIFGNKMNIDLNTLEITTSADSVHAFIDAIKPKFNIRLCGSRYFAQRDVFIRLNIDEFTDYDYFCQTNDELKQILTQKGWLQANHRPGYMDNLCESIWYYNTPSKQKFQIVMRTDAELYNKVLESIDPRFYAEHLWKSNWKSCPTPKFGAPTKDKIQAIFNQLFITASQK